MFVEILFIVLRDISINNEDLILCIIVIKNFFWIMLKDG